MRDTHHFVALLQEIQALAPAAEQIEVEEAVQRVIEQVDRIAAWGGARQRAWSDYYQHVHRYLRDVVRLDPDRALSQRLRDQLAIWPKGPFHLLVAHAPSIRLLRQLEARVERPVVARPRAERELTPEWVEAENARADLEVLVREAIANGARTLAAVTSHVLPRLPEAAHYAAAGRVADALVRVAAVRAERERPWAPVHDRLEVEDWQLRERGPAR